MGFSENDRATEHETIVQWSDADDGTAHVYSAQREMVKLAVHPKAQHVKYHKTERGQITGLECDLPRTELFKILLGGKG